MCARCRRPQLPDETLVEQAGTAQAREQARLIFLGKFVFPEAQHPPAAGAEGASDEAVASLVACDLRPPELRVLRAGRVELA